eukprot:9171758-Pyramimonas_sp.AAC.1
MRRLRGIRTDFRYLFWNFREIARAVHKAGGVVCIEWPTQCNYCRDPQQGYGKKPWTIATTSSVVAEGLERRCDGTHEHVEARGRECKSAEDYTGDFAKQVHFVVARAAERPLSSRRRPISSSHH